jgi:hypothetical protein
MESQQKVIRQSKHPATGTVIEDARLHIGRHIQLLFIVISKVEL